MNISGLAKSFNKNIPNIFTMLNLLSGCMAILLSFHDIALAGIVILLAGVFDFADGMAARMLNAYSDFGKELDSLADMVSFGVAPSFVLFHMLKMSLIVRNPTFSIEILSAIEIIVLATSFLPAVCAAIRLAKFNTSGVEGEFSGLPSPASGMFFASLGYVLLTTDTGWVQNSLLSTPLMVLLNLIISLLMVTSLPMFTIKFRSLKFKANRTRYIFSIPAIILFLYLGIKAIPVIIIWYILLSIAVVMAPGLRQEKQ